MSIEAKGTLLGLAAGMALLGVTFGFAPFLQPAKAAASTEPPINSGSVSASPDRALEGEARRGRSLFEHNCAHCHGEDARGDEGPSLYDLEKSSARITRIIKEGIKGEMPRFGAKFKEADIQALIAYLRTLKS